jgi:hypothetical protein
MKKGKSKNRGKPATKEVEREVVIEVNCDELTCMLCQ